MVRAILATVAALVLVGVVSLLIIESRAVKEDYYVAHAGKMRAIESSANDIDAIIQGTRGAFDEGRAIPSSIDLAFARLRDNRDLLQVPTTSAAKDSSVLTQFAAYESQLEQFITNGQAFATRQNSLAEALRLLQEESPTVVKDLRRFNLRIQSQNAFSLAIDVIDFAIGGSQTNAEQLASRIEALSTDRTVSSEAPGRMDDFLKAATSVLAEHTAAKIALAEIGNSEIATELSLLSVGIQNDNRHIVSRAERARLLLAVCAVLLLIGAGYTMLRLQTSYRELNKSNAELAKVNDSLEQRVVARTEELSDAYDELKESQVQLVQAEKMSSLGGLVAGISHEINTPLWYLISNSTVIHERLTEVGGLLDVVEKMVAAARSRTAVKESVSAGLVEMNKMLAAGLKEDIDEAKDLAQDSIEGLQELTELAQSLKDFSRLDRAKQGQFDVNEGLNKTLLIVKNKVKHKATVHKHFGEVPSILCSPSQINQVFLNLIVNAADAIEHQGDIVFHTWTKDGKVGVRISDTGCGISAEDMSKIRDPFFTTKEVGKGTGLGLSIVDQIITSHHGTMKVESTPGKGTTITVELPIEPPAETAVEKPAKPSNAITTEVAEKAVPETAEEADWAGDTNAVAAGSQTFDGAPADSADTAEAGANPGPAGNDQDAEEDDWAGDTNVVEQEAGGGDSAGHTNVVEQDAAEFGKDGENDDWAGDTNVAEANAGADTAAPDGKADDEDWAGNTNVSEATAFTAEANNDADYDDQAVAAGATVDATAEAEIAANAENCDDEAAEVSASHNDDVDDNSARVEAAETDDDDVASAEDVALDDFDNDEIDPYAETDVAAFDAEDDADSIGPDDVTMVADWHIETDIVRLFPNTEDNSAEDAAARVSARKSARTKAKQRNLAKAETLARVTEEPPEKTDT